MNIPITSPLRIPVIKTGQALESLRDSGHSLPTALGEPIDNSLEAKANHISVRLDEGKPQKGKSHIHRIVIADDGIGMAPEILHHYPVLGFSTRYMQTDTIGKYGVGAKLAALNFARRIDVWSRQEPTAPWLHVHFDLDEAMQQEHEGGEAGIDAPVELPVPQDVVDLLPKGSGTVVVWSRIDRLEDGRHAENCEQLRLDVEKELSRIFRFFIHGGKMIVVNGKQLLPHDPLMLMDNSWADKVLNDSIGERKNPKHFGAELISKEPIQIGDRRATLTVTLYPKEVTRQRGMGRDDLAKKLRVPENQGSISFVRHHREVSYTNVPRIFPRGVQDPDRFVGIEITFDPTMDSYFGVRNVKRGVEPHGELRNQIRKLLERHLKTARRTLEESWGKEARNNQKHLGEHTTIVEEAAKVDPLMPKGQVSGPLSEEAQKKIFEDLANDVIPSGDEKAKAEYLTRLEKLPYVIESVDWPGKSFVEIKHVVGKIIIRLNTRHPFYREMWEPVKHIAQREPGNVSGEEAVKACHRTIDAMTLLLIAFGKAQSMDADPEGKYGDLTEYWGQFLGTLLTKVHPPTEFQGI